MSALRQLLLRLFPWSVLFALAVVAALLGYDATLDAPWGAGVAAVAALLVHLPGVRAHAWRRRLSEPILVAALVGSSAYALLRWVPCAREAFQGERPLCWLGALLGAALVVRLLVPPAAGGRVLRLVGVELAKLLRGRLLKVGLLLCIAVPLLAGWKHEPGTGETGWALAARLLGSGTWSAEILLLVLGAVAIAGEIGQGTMKMVLPHAYRRSDWVLAKGVVLALVALVFTALVAGSSLGYAAAELGLGDVVKEVPAGFGEEESVEVFQSAEVMRGHFVDTALATLASAVATAMLALFISTLFSNVVPALSTGFLLFVGLQFGDLLLGLTRAVEQQLYPSFPGWMRELVWNLGRGFNDRWDPELLSRGVWLAGLTTLLALLAATRIFDRRELG